MFIFLIGFMGAGKSHTGKKLAAKLDFSFVDLDALIIEKVGKPIATIFEEQGEAAFRELESAALKNLGSRDKVVIATGGGAPCFHGNMEWMNNIGLTVYLKATPELLADRLQGESAHRPLVAQLSAKDLLDFIRSKIKERAAFYEQAELVYKQTNNHDAAKELAKFFLSL